MRIAPFFWPEAKIICKMLAKRKRFLYICSLFNQKPKNMTKELSVCLIGKCSPYKVAMMDITEYLRNQKLQIVDQNGDVWIVTPSRMHNKETNRLNMELGLHKVNKCGNKMAR